MNFTEIVILDYIDEWEQEVTVYVHTKDKRMLAVHDVVSNPTISNNVLYIAFMQWGKEMTFALPKDDFSHLEFYYKSRQNISKENFVEEEVCPPDLLTEPDEGLFEDLI